MNYYSTGIEIIQLIYFLTVSIEKEKIFQHRLELFFFLGKNILIVEIITSIFFFFKLFIYR